MSIIAMWHAPHSGAAFLDRDLRCAPIAVLSLPVPEGDDARCEVVLVIIHVRACQAKVRQLELALVIDEQVG